MNALIQALIWLVIFVVASIIMDWSNVSCPERRLPGMLCPEDGLPERPG